jgi:hypothetical protein
MSTLPIGRIERQFQELASVTPSRQVRHLSCTFVSAPNNRHTIVLSGPVIISKMALLSTVTGPRSTR